MRFDSPFFTRHDPGVQPRQERHADPLFLGLSEPDRYFLTVFIRALEVELSKPKLDSPRRRATHGNPPSFLKALKTGSTAIKKSIA